MEVSLNSSQRIIDFYKDYSSLNFSAIPKTTALFNKIFDVFSNELSNVLTFCNLSTQCRKGSECEAICKNELSSPNTLRIYANSSDYFQIQPNNTVNPDCGFLLSTRKFGDMRYWSYHFLNLPKFEIVDALIGETRTSFSLESHNLSSKEDSSFLALNEQEAINHFKSTLSEYKRLTQNYKKTRITEIREMTPAVHEELRLLNEKKRLQKENKAKPNGKTDPNTNERPKDNKQSSKPAQKSGSIAIWLAGVGVAAAGLGLYANQRSGQQEQKNNDLKTQDLPPSKDPKKLPKNN